MANEVKGINDIPTSFDEDKQAETHSVVEWCMKLNIKLLDEAYYDDPKVYTIQEFEQLIPRDIEVPLNSKDYSKLIKLIEDFYQDKSELDKYKKITDEENKDIKEIMLNEKMEKFETDELVAKITVQKRESFDEDKLLQIVKELNVPGIIKTKEYVDTEALENAIYQGNLDASKLNSCRISKEITVLKVAEKK